MVFIFPIAVWLGILTISSFFITFSLGIAVHKFHKHVFKYHMCMAFLTTILAIVHIIFVILFLGGIII